MINGCTIIKSQDDDQEEEDRPKSLQDHRTNTLQNLKYHHENSHMNLLTLDSSEPKIYFRHSDEAQQQAFVPGYHDQTGTFNWIHDVPINIATMTPAQASHYNFKNHIVLCLVGPTAGGPLNLTSFIMPFRFHWLPVQSIVILGDSRLISTTEWLKLRNFPRVYIVNVSNYGFGHFSQGSPCSFTDLQAVKILQCASCCIIGDSGNISKVDEADVSLQDKNTLFCAMNIRSLLRREDRSVHMTTELRHENNAHHFTTQNTHEIDLKLPLRFQEPFARGIIFSNSLLYSSISSLYFNGDVFLFLRVLIAGQSTHEIESLFAFGSGLQRDQEGKPLISGVSVELKNFIGPPFNIIIREEALMSQKVVYRVLFERCLMYWRILLVGLYRLNEQKVRYVFTNPAPDTILFDSDKIYCFIPPEYEVPVMRDMPKVKKVETDSD
ncbi:hypothetical protein Ciccas_005007 [Cichlidogyrus casuarinus]|uniref:Uncharacterized protein n=1 Tax=Cichlidogyrus casuarinus TaxID=1844966 RepID=A0ABD2QC68_9PLAT